MKFDPLKVVQASAVVLRFHGRRASRLRLLKILAIADREALAETLETITGDHLVAMDHGPVLSQTYDTLKGESVHSILWNRYIEQAGPQDLRLAFDPNVDLLSRYEIEKLEAICDRFRLNNDYELAEYTHTFPEWIKNCPPKGSSRPIPLDDVLGALGMADQAKIVKERDAQEAELDRLFRTEPA